MEFLIVTTLFAFAETISVRSTCVVIRGENYEKELLVDNVYIPYQLTVDFTRNILFFSHTANQTDYDNQMFVTFKVAFLSLKKKHFGHVSGVKDGFATAVNNQNGDIYIGAENGIYKVDDKSGTAINLDVIDLTIWQMFYKDGLYFTTYPDQEVFLYKDDCVIEIPDFHAEGKVKTFAVKSDGVYVFSNSSGLYSWDKTNKSSIYLGDYSISGFASDVDDNLYFSTDSKIYYFGEKIEELIEITDIFGLAIAENGDFIYATTTSIMRLKLTRKRCA